MVNLMPSGEMSWKGRAMTPPDLPPLTRYTGYLLRRAFVKASHCVGECIPADAHIREVAALSILAERGPLSQQSLGAVAHVNRSAVVKLVDTLEAKSWVVRVRTEGDRRTYALTLTEPGLATLAEFGRDLDRGEAALTVALSDEEVERLRGWLTQLLAGDPSIGIKSLSGRTGYLIAHAHRWLRDRAAERLDPVGIAPRDFGVLSTLAREEPCSQSHLAASLGISAPGVVHVLAELEATGLVSRVRTAGDRRVYDLTLTGLGRARLGEAQRVAADLQDDVRQRLGAAGDEDLRQLLLRLVG